jgi:uncharacterized Zn finger protein (UPF0148 family)
MKIRGQRECRDCGTRWSYYETGSVECPDCGSLRSRGLDDRTEHTDAPAELDLTAARGRVETDGVVAAAAGAAEDCRAYVRKRGFINAGELLALSERYLAAAELAAVAGELDRSLRVDDDEEIYLLALLRGTDHGERPGPEAVPASLAAARALAYADAIGRYRDDCRTYLEEHPDPAARSALGTVGEHVRRVEALDGAVDPATVERLVVATRELGEYLRTGEESRLATARSRLDGLD